MEAPTYTQAPTCTREQWRARVEALDLPVGVVMDAELVGAASGQPFEDVNAATDEAVAKVVGLGEAAGRALALTLLSVWPAQQRR